MQMLTWKIWIHSRLFNIWQSHYTPIFLYPLEVLYNFVIRLQRYFNKPKKFNIKTIVVGNPTLGGSGKTPVVIELAILLSACHKKVGVVTRGYARPIKKKISYLSTFHDDYDHLGDEAFLISKKTRLPVAAGPNRVHSVKLLLKHHDLDIVIFDDGLSSMQVYFDTQIVLLGKIQQYGNGNHLPSGPLRKPLDFYKNCDILINEAYVHTNQSYLKRLTSDKLFKGTNPCEFKVLEELSSCFCVTGIAYPKPLIDYLSKFISIEPLIVADHERISLGTLKVLTEIKPVIMTEKDWIKICDDPCYQIVLDKIWVTTIQLSFSKTFEKALMQCINIKEQNDKKIYRTVL